MRITHRHYCLFVICAVTLLSGCKKDIIDDIAGGDQKDKTITFFTQNTVTRGTPLDDISGYPNVSLTAYDHTGSWNGVASAPYINTTLIKQGSNWTYSPPKFWPEGRILSLFAHSSNIPLNGGVRQDGISVSTDVETKVPVISYQIPSDATLQPDLIVTRQVDTPHPAGAKIKLDMKHALTCVGIKAAGYGKRISNIYISGVADNGTLSLDYGSNISWDVSDATYTEKHYPKLKETELLLGKEIVTLNSNDGHLMMIPQQIPPEARLHVTVNGVEYSLEIQYLLTEWEPGRKVYYLIDVTNPPTVIVDFEGSILSNCYIVNPSPSKDVVLQIPINRVNQFWGNSFYETEKFDDNTIRPGDDWRVSVMWFDTDGLATVKDGGGIYLTKTVPKETKPGINDYFEITVPRGFTKRGNLIVGISKGDKNAILVNGGTSDDGRNPSPGSQAVLLWSWHVWVTDYDPYPDHRNGTAGYWDNQYIDVRDGFIWRGSDYSFTFGPSWAGTVASGQFQAPWDKTASSIGNKVWSDGGVRFLLDRPIGVRNKNWGSDPAYAQIKDWYGESPNTAANGNGIMYYQFGRKDPFPADIPLYTLDYTTGVQIPLDYSATANGVPSKKNVWWTICNPLRMVYVDATGYPTDIPGLGDWTADEFSQSTNESVLWMDPLTANNPTAKSIFDPSPWMYRVPRSGAFNCLANSNFRTFFLGSTVGNDPNNPNYSDSPRGVITDPQKTEYLVAADRTVVFWAWGSRFWRSGRWNDQVGYNGQYWMSGTVAGVVGWDFYLLNQPQDWTYFNGVSSPRISPNEPGIRASTMALMPVQDDLPAGGDFQLPKWSYDSQW